MNSRHSSLAPARTTPLEETSRVVMLPRPSRFEPQRDALTRVRHDVRSLVHAMLGYSDLLTEPHYGSLNADQLRFVGHVRSAAEQLQELVDTCIELSRATSDPRGIELPVVPLDAVLRRVSGALKESGIACDIEVSSQHEGRQLALDVGLFQRAISGLALVASREGAVSCTLRTMELQGRMHVRLRSSDAAEIAPFATLDRFADRVANRDFVRLKLSEVLLSRQHVALRLTGTLDSFDLELT